MKRYTVGFVFDHTMENVLLIHKQRPDWQKGKLNGPGGKIEENETPHECISREMREETNLAIPPAQWKLFADLGTEDWNVQFFGTTYDQPEQARSLTDEKIEWVNVKKIPSHAIDNLHWLIPLCIDQMKNKIILMTKVQYEKGHQ